MTQEAENPYQPPTAVAASPPANSQKPAWRKLSAPAGVILAGNAILFLSLSVQFVTELITLIWKADPRWNEHFASYESILSIYFPWGLSAVGIYGGIQMLRMRSYFACVLAALVITIQPFPCAFLMTAIGGWSLIVLLQKDTRAAFAESA